MPKHLSFTIITLNEADNIEKCLRSLPQGFEVVVVDSHSQDQTVEIAERCGAKVISNTFEDYAAQKNLAATQAGCDWIFSIDADETLSPDLRAFIEKTFGELQGGSSYSMEKVAALRCVRKLLFMGKLLRFGKATDRPIKIYNRQHAKFQGKVHEKIIADPGFSISKIGRDSAFLAHRSYKDLSDYYLRFNKYTSMIAGSKGGLSSASFLMHVMRPWFEFFSRYVLRGGFLDGYPGYVYALISSQYAFIKYAKYYEKKFQDSASSVQ